LTTIYEKQGCGRIKKGINKSNGGGNFMAIETVKNVQGSKSPASYAAPRASSREKKRSFISLTIGILLASSILTLPLIAYPFKMVVAFVHEVGHSTAGWLFGYASIPTVDIMYGGGITIMQERSLLLMLMIYMAFAWIGYRHRRSRGALVLWAVVVFVYTLIAFTFLHEVLILSAGHAAELFLAGLVLWLAVNNGMVNSLSKQLIYAFTGALILISNIVFSYRLISDPSYQQGYIGIKGSGFRMDLSRIADEFLGVDVSTVALVFLVACIFTPVVSFFCYRYRYRLAGFLQIAGK